MVANDTLLNIYDTLRFQLEIICSAVCEEKMYVFVPLIFSNIVKRHVVEYDKLRYQPEVICNVLCEECL